MGLPWQVAWAPFSGALLVFIADYLPRALLRFPPPIPVSLRVGITSASWPVYRHDGAENAGVIVANPETLVVIGNLTSHQRAAGGSRFFIITVDLPLLRATFMRRLVSIIVTTRCLAG